MEISIISQFLIMLMSVLLGLALGAIYDVIRIIRAFLGITYANKFTQRLSAARLPLIKNPFCKSRKSSKRAETVIVFVSDVLYFCVISLIMMVYIYHVNSGIIRWYIFAGVILGGIAYYFTIGKLIISFSEYVVFGIKVFFSYLIYFPSRPIVALIRKIKLLKSKRKEKKKAKIKSNTKKKNSRTELMKMGKNKF